jgi:hypothetical protein
MAPSVVDMVVVVVVNHFGGTHLGDLHVYIQLSAHPPQVGSFYKSPTCPIWVVFAESHYSVLFAFDTCVYHCGGSSSRVV